MQQIRQFFVFYLILSPLYIELSTPSLNTKLVTQQSLTPPCLLRVHDGFITGSYYVITMRLVYDNYVIHIPSVSFVTLLSGNGVVSRK